MLLHRSNFGSPRTEMGVYEMKYSTRLVFPALSMHPVPVRPHRTLWYIEFLQMQSTSAAVQSG